MKRPIVLARSSGLAAAVAVCSLFAVLVDEARAQLMEHQVQHYSWPGGVPESFDQFFQKFNSLGGTRVLRRVELRLFPVIETSVEFTNLSPLLPAEASLAVSAVTRATLLPDQSLVLPCAASQQSSIAPGETVQIGPLQCVESGLLQVGLDPERFAPLVGSGQVTIPIEIDSSGEVTSSAVLNRQSWSVESFGSVRLTYFYEERAAQGPCVADINLDGDVNGADLSVLLTMFGRKQASSRADINGDGRVDGADLAVLLHAFGRNCQVDY